MKWSNVRLIFFREFRDQLRDRRTLFTIAVLPLLLYPLMGISFFRFSQFLSEHPTDILVVSADGLPQDPPLFDGEQFVNGLCSPADAQLMRLVIHEGPLAELANGTLPPSSLEAGPLEAEDEALFVERQAQQLIASGEYQAVVYFPQGFAEALSRFRAQLRDGSTNDSDSPIPAPEIITNEANKKSQVAGGRVEMVLRNWRESIVEKNLLDSRIPVAATRPFHLINTDVAAEATLRAALWAKILPFVVLIWALTGAFYPAIDLCAGEKERGTLETLLSSPAERSEIVWGKLLTIMSFSMMTSLLNLASMGATGAFVIGQLERMGAVPQVNIGPPPLVASLWLILALIPISALFSALSLAVAAFARSSKEGQYYLMPLLLITLPLMMLAILPTTELQLGTSLIPVTGMMMLLQALVEGRHAVAIQFALPVLAVTATCCLLAIRWAVHQFNDESVLFRENERFGLGLWLKHLVRDRKSTPGLGEALLCGVVLLVIRFFANFLIPPTTTWSAIASTTVVMQIALIATPALLMAIMLTRDPRRTLLLNRPRWLAIPAAIALAACLNPLVQLMGAAIEYLYPMGPTTLAALEPLLVGIREAPLWQVLLVIAVTPAICEELAFRGFILSGLQRTGNKWTAIGVSAVLFGMAHGIWQQSISTCIIGLVIAYVAVQTKSLLPCMAFHVTSNGLSVITSRLNSEFVKATPALDLLFESTAEGACSYRSSVAVAAILCSGLLLLWFGSLTRKTTAAPQTQSELASSVASL